MINAPSFSSAPEHLYIHWPFCSKKCYYCDFVALEQHESFQDAYFKSLSNEIFLFAKQQPQIPLKTIYLGGGTPSLFPIEDITKLYQQLYNQFDCSQLIESVIETNPADITEERLDAWLDCGINRLSVGIQALDDDVLLKLNRRQRIHDVQNVMKIAPKYFKNISADFILGLPGISEKRWKETLQAAVLWPITHISIYFLTIHEKTPLYFKVERGEMDIATDESFIRQYKYTIEFLAQHGFEQYETSNFAKNKASSLHNQAYWDHKPYRGFGLGASSFSGSYRFTNENNLSNYIAHYDNSSQLTCKTSEKLSKWQLFIERLMLGLRQRHGIDLHSMLYLLSEEQKSDFFSKLSKLEKTDLIIRNGNIITLTSRGMTLENEIIVNLM